MKPIVECHLYGILDLGYVERTEVRRVAGEMITGGVDLIQLRAKQSSPAGIEAMGREILPITRKAGIPLIINDYPEVAAAVGAEGVHVGQDDADMDSVRSAVGQSMIVGRSTHSLDQAAAAAREGADYIGFGPVFATPTKPEYPPIGTEHIQRVHAEHADLPIFCIGGIKRENLPELIAAGARRVVIVSGILQSSDIGSYVRDARTFLR